MATTDDYWSRRMVRLLIMIIWTAAAVISIYKFASGNPQGWGLPYFYINYKLGFIRRALLGHFVSPFIVGLEASAAKVRIFAISTTALIFFVAFLVWLSSTALHKMSTSQRTIWTAVGLLFFFSPATMMLGWHIGLIDIVLFLVMSIATIAFLWGWRIATIALAFLGPFVHEGFVFLWLPLQLTLMRTDRVTSVLSIIATMSAAAVMIFATTKQFALPLGIPMEPEALSGFATTQLSQGAISAIRHMVLDELPRHWPNLIAGTVYYIGPSVVGIAVAGTFISWRAAVRVTLGTMMCAAILLTAWDLGRFLSWAATVAFIQTSLEMRDCPLTGKVRRGFAQALTIIVLLALAAFFALSPLLDCFFNGCFVIGAEQQLVLRSLAEWHKDLAMQFKRP